ncbi:MAG: hypothetical protein ABSD71_13350 [Bacteroidales bacterium]|jgi:hypothetical protein
MEKILRTIQADDKLELMALKTSTDGKKTTLLTECWKELTSYQYKDGKLNKKSFFNPETKEHISPEEYNKRGNPNTFLPVIPKEIKIDDNTEFVLEGNEIKLRLRNLAGNFKNRYLKAIECLIESNIFEYNPQKRNLPTNEREYNEEKRRAKEAFRQKLNKNFFISAYEWNIIFINPEMGKIFYNAIIAKAKAGKKNTKQVENTIYLQGFNAEAKKKVKVYNQTACHIRKDNDFNYIPGDIIKIEFTYKNHWFKEKGIVIKDLTEPIDIFSLLKDFIVIDLINVYKLLNDDNKKEVCRMLGVKK